MKKKLLSIVLSILMIITVSQVNVHAETEIKSIDLTEIFDPDADFVSMDENFGSDFFTKIMNFRTNVYIDINLYRVFDVTGAEPVAVDPNSVFLADHTYSLLLVLYENLEDGYHFSNPTGSFDLNSINPRPTSAVFNGPLQVRYEFNGTSSGGTEDSIDEIDLSFILNIPQYNNLINRIPSYFFGTLGTVEFENMNFLGCQVYNQTDGFVMTDNNVFENGDSWVVSLFYEAKEGYNFDSIDINNISPKPTAIKTGVYTYNAQGSKVEYSENNKAIQLMYYIYNTSNPNLIHSIDLSELDIGNFNNMNAGDVIELINNFNFSQFHMSLINHIEIPSVLIERTTSPEKYKELENDDVFEKGEQYMLTILLKANEGYSFPYLTVFNHDYAGSFTVGDRVSELYVKVGDCVNELIDLGSVQYRNGLCIECIFSNDDIPIKNINLSSVIPTDFSQYEDLKASELISNSNSWDFGELINKGAVCFKESGNNFILMDSTESFALGKEYELVLYLQAPEGKIFDSEYSEDLDGYIYKGQFSPTGIGTIEVGEITLSSGNININTSKDSDNYTNPKNGMKVVIPFTVGDEISVVNISSWSELSDAINNHSSQNLSFKLVNDLTAEEGDTTFIISDGLDVKIDLNGHIINRNLVTPEGSWTNRNGQDRGSVFHVEGNLKITDSNPNTAHDGYVDRNGVWHVACDEHPTANEKSKTIYGGIITGGIGFYRNTQISHLYNNEINGGGIYIDSTTSNTSVTMNGGTICGNVAVNRGGGVAINMMGSKSIYNDDLATFVMNGGTICNNSAPSQSTNPSFGGGIYVRYGHVIINDGHIDENIAQGKGGGIYKDSEADLTIKSGTIKNNTANITGAIYSFGSYQQSMSLLASPGKEIVITGNKCEKKGNVYSFETHISGKVIIKNNKSTGLAKVCGYTGRLYYPDPQGIYKETEHFVDHEGGGMPFTFTIPYLDGYYYPNDMLIDDAEDEFGCNQKIYVEGDLTGSDINLTTAGFFELDFESSKFLDIDCETIIDYSTYNPDAKVDTYFHHAGPSLYHLELNKTDGSIYVKTTPVKVTDSSNFIDTIDAAIEEYEGNEDSKITIDLNENIGDKNTPLDTGDEGLYIPPNVGLNLNGHDIYIDEDETVIIDGDIKDSGGDDGDGNPKKGRIFLNNPEDLIYDSEEESDDEGGTRLEPVWTPASGDLKGYYCIYQIGANTKWDKTDDNKEWLKPGDNEGKFKVQPTAYLDISNELGNYDKVYAKNSKVRAGLRLSLYKKNSNVPSVYYFAFSEDLTNSWAINSPTTRCMYVPVSGLKPFERVEAQAAIFSKPDDKMKDVYAIQAANARFFSANKAAGSK